MAHHKVTKETNSKLEAIQHLLNTPIDDEKGGTISTVSAVETQDFMPPKVFLESVRQAPIAISITDPNARILFVNSAFERLTGYQSKEIIGENQSVLSSKSTPLEIYQDLWKTIKDKKVWKGTLVNHGKDKREYIAELTITPVLNQQSEVSYYLGMHRDFTELHQLEQRLKFQKHLTEEAINAAPMVVAMLDSKLKPVMDNHAYKALMGDFRGREPAQLIFDSLELQVGRVWEKEDSERTSISNVDVRLDPVGSAEPRWFSCSVVKVLEMDEAASNYFRQSAQSDYFLLLIANEITASRKRIIEARLNMIRANMSEQQMVQSMHEAISGAIYKLQIPLNIIRASLSIPGSDTQSSLYSSLQNALETGEEAMDSLHAALPSPKTEQTSPVNINEILHEVLKLSTEALLSAGIVVDWRPSTMLPYIEGRPNALRGMFKYLLDNAIQAVRESEQDYREIRVQTRHENEQVVIEIMDNGPGITKSQLIKVYEPFYSGWNLPGNHSGMGLTMASEVALNHSGDISIDGDFLGGCRVFVTMPTTQRS